MSKVATMTKDEVSETAPKRPYLFPSNSLLEAQFMRNEWGLNVPRELPYERLFEPGVWKLISRRLAIGDEITARCEALSYWAKLIVVAVDHVTAGVVVKELIKVDFSEAGEGKSRDHLGYRAIDTRTLTDRWIVKRIADGHVMARGLDDEMKAIAMIVNQFAPNDRAQAPR